MKRTIDDLVRSTASLTNTIADKDAVIGAVIDNLNTVLTTIDERDEQLDSLLVNTQRSSAVSPRIATRWVRRYSPSRA